MDLTAEYIKNGGWSSFLFAKQAIPFIQELREKGVPIEIGRHEIIIGNVCRAQVHMNGRPLTHATITDINGAEIQTFHFTQFAALKACILEQLKT